MFHGTRTRRALVRGVVAASLLAGTVTAGSPAVHAGACAVARPYSLPAVVSDKAWANAHGSIGPMFDSDDAVYEFSLTLTAQQAQYLRESIEGGCAPHVTYSTRGTVLAMGASGASFDGRAEASIDGVSLGGAHHAGSFPLPSGCLTALSCQENLTHVADIPFAASAGATVSVVGAGSATAFVLVPNQYHQAHADFWIRYPVLRIPIP